MLNINIDGKYLDTSSGFTLTMQENVFNPTSPASKSASYSYSFKIPITPHNRRILGYYDVLESNEKIRRYNAECTCDGSTLFVGSLVITGAENGEYSCNLVSLKSTNYTEKLGDKTLATIDWSVPFSGIDTINAVNADNSKKYFFPLASYGCFQKSPVYEDDVAAEYSSKFLIDKYNKWWYSSFYPSINALEVAKRGLEQYGFEVAGSAFDDPVLSNVYLSTNLADGQVPVYNLGNQLFGHVRVANHFTTSAGADRYMQDLDYPYFRVQESYGSKREQSANFQYNLETIDYWNLLKGGTLSHNSYLYDRGDSVVVIPTSGWYKISLSANTQLVGYGSTMAAPHWVDYWDSEGIHEEIIRVPINASETAPLEIQVVRNVSEDNTIELIKGDTNIKYRNGNPMSSTFNYSEGGYGWRPDGYPNKVTWTTAYPHQAIKGQTEAPTKTEKVLDNSVQNNTKTQGTINNIDTSRMSGRGTTGRASSGRASGVVEEGYIRRNTHVYDPVVSQSFICGLSSFDGGIPSVMRNGNSWSPTMGAKNDVYANVEGFKRWQNINGSKRVELTNYCSNDWDLADINVCSATSSTMRGHVECCVWLNRNDIIEVVGIQRNYMGQTLYSWTGDITFEVTAISDHNRAWLDSHDFDYYSPTFFSDQLQLSNFMNSATTISSYIDSLCKAFNLSISQDGQSISIDTNNASNATTGQQIYAINIDKRIVSGNTKTGNGGGSIERIDWPAEMSVKWTINTEEFGFKSTIPEEHVGEPDEDDYGYSGFTVIKLNDDPYSTETKDVSIPFSYNWYCSFLFQQLDQSGETLSEHYINLPVIIQDSYMTDYKYYENDMSHDGYSLRQRFWFRQAPSSDYVYTADREWREQCYLTYPTGTFMGVSLSYDEQDSLLKYFNIKGLNSEYTNVSAYITNEEYLLLKAGACIQYNSDIYYVSSLQFTPTTHIAKLKLVRKND